MSMLIDRRSIAHFDFGLLGISLLILTFGLLVLYSAGNDPDLQTRLFEWMPLETHSPTFAKQIFFIIAGLSAMFVGLSLSPQVLLRIAYPFYGLCILLLVAVLFHGSEAKGAQRWLSLGGFTFQPAELMKFALILAMARLLSRMPPKQPGGYTLWSLILPFGVFLLPLALIMAQPDLGTGLAITSVGFSMVLFMGIRWKALALMFGFVVAAVFPIWTWVLHPYQKRRIQVLIDPDADPLGSGYHIIQSKIAVGSGQFFGKGFMNGTQTQLEFLPEHSTDFIFSVLGEEWGFFGSLIVVMLYMILIYRLLRVVLRGKDLFLVLVAFGIAAQIFFNSIINIGMVIGLLPVVGLPLPLFSYGGTSLISTLFAIGIVLGISMRRFSYLSGT